MKNRGGKTDPWKELLFIVITGVTAGAAVDFYNIAWGTGRWLGEFSFTWAVLFIIFSAICSAGLFILANTLWNPQRGSQLNQFFVRLRERIGILRWALAILAVLAPAWFLQYTYWGVVFSKPSTRLLIWFIAIIILAFLISLDPTRALTWRGTLIAALLSGASFALTVPFMQVTSYPFSLGWSEGNRLWDYSVLFGRRLYDYPSGKPYKAFLDLGRQFVGGVPFLLPHVSIWAERFWLGLTNTIPYLAAGWIIFGRFQKNAKFWLLMGIWSFMFLNQGPIHTPLVICAALVALAWDRSLWLAIPLVLLSGYFAVTTRFTWVFAPAIWAGMLELSGATLVNGNISRRTWVRAIASVCAGAFGGFALPYLLKLINKIRPLGFATLPLANTVSTTTVVNGVSHQPLLWYRLLPNSTYGYGIILGLVLAVGPLVILLVFEYLKGGWTLNRWQKLGILLPSAAFLAVGLIASTKIGGGGDLHNNDMFLISLLFTAAIYCKNGGDRWVLNFEETPRWVTLAVFMAVMIPAYPSLMSLKPISFANDIPRLITLTDSDPYGKSLGSLPADDKVQADLNEIQKEVESDKTKGDILFMDQRQLLTFGYIKNVTLVPEYDKKLLIDQAMSDNEAYFQSFYKDLAAHRFSLIISDRLRTPIRDSEFGFSEENNAWVKWVAKPVLCFYQERDTLTDVGVEMLGPNETPTDCSSVLP